MTNPRPFSTQGEFGAQEGEIEGRGAMPSREGVGGFLRVGQAAAHPPQHQLQPGQGLRHEADHQLPAHAESALHRSVAAGGAPTDQSETFNSAAVITDTESAFLFLLIRITLQSLYVGADGSRLHDSVNGWGQRSCGQSCHVMMELNVFF